MKNNHANAVLTILGLLSALSITGALLISTPLSLTKRLKDAQSIDLQSQALSVLTQEAKSIAGVCGAYTSFTDRITNYNKSSFQVPTCDYDLYKQQLLTNPSASPCPSPLPDTGATIKVKIKCSDLGNGKYALEAKFPDQPKPIAIEFTDPNYSSGTGCTYISSINQLSAQTGLFVYIVHIVNNSASSNSCRIIPQPHNSDLYVYTAINSDGLRFIDTPIALAPQQAIDVKLEFNNTTRAAYSPTPVFDVKNITPPMPLPIVQNDANLRTLSAPNLITYPIIGPSTITNSVHLWQSGPWTSGLGNLHTFVLQYSDDSGSTWTSGMNRIRYTPVTGGFATCAGQPCFQIVDIPRTMSQPTNSLSSRRYRMYLMPSCTDGVQNQGETGVDCGGSCAPCSAPTTGTWTAVGLILGMKVGALITTNINVKNELNRILPGSVASNGQVDWGKLKALVPFIAADPNTGTLLSTTCTPKDGLGVLGGMSNPNGPFSGATLNLHKCQ